MADFNSSLPVRTQDAGDVIVKLADSLVPSQQAQITAARELSVLSTAQPGIDIGDVTINNAAGAAAVNIQDGGNSITVDAINLDIRDLSSASDSVTVIQGTSPWISKDQADGPVSPGSPASFSMLVGAQYNLALPTLTDTDQVALQVDSSGRLIISPLSGSAVTVTNLPATVDVNYGVVGASTLRSAAQIGNATGAADFNAGATGAQTLRVIANQGAANATPWNENIAQIAGSAPSASNSLPVQLSDGSAFYSDINPLPVKIGQEGTPVNDFKMASSIASGASDNHDYTAVGDFYLNQIEASSSGKAKMEVAIETGVASGVFDTIFVQFNSTAETNMSVSLSDPALVAAGVRVRVSMSNRDLLAQNLYSTISGLET